MERDVVLRWTPERREFMEAVVRYTRRRCVTRPVVIVAEGVIATVLLFAWWLLSSWGSSSTGLLLAVAACEILVLGLVVGPMPWWSARRQWQGSPRLRDPVEMVLSAAGVTVRGKDSESRIGWSGFDEVSDAGRSYRLHLRGQSRPRIFIVIPKRAMPGPDGGAELGEILRRSVRSAA
jgi:hypothetical protein